MRRTVLDHGVRADGRGCAEVRPIWSRAGATCCVQPLMFH